MIQYARDRQRGFVLLVALGVLGVLGLLAATFATLSRVERVASSSYVDKVRARLLAQSGIERTLASLRGRAMVQAWDDTRNDWYYREMLNAEPGTGIVYPASVKTDIWKYVPTRSYGMPPRTLEMAFDQGMSGAPSGISFPQPKTPGVNEGFSGEFPGTYNAQGDLYALKVLDCASMINVNDGGERIPTLLNNLGDILKCDDGAPVNLPTFRLGDKLVARGLARQKPFNNKAEILEEVFLADPDAGGAVAGRKRFEAVKNFITCHGWIDGMTTRFVNTWMGATDYAGGSYASATAGTGGGGGSGTGGGSGGGAVGGGGGGSGGGLPGILPTDPVKAGLGVPEFATSPLYSMSASIPGAYASMPATAFLAAPALSPLTDPKGGGGGFRQFVTGQGNNAALGGQTKVGKFGGTFYRMEPRCPINVNTASREVLVAMLMGLEADFWDYTVVDESAATKEYNSRLGNINVKITPAEAEAIADFLISGRFTHGAPAGSWSYNDWMHFEDEVLNKIPGLNRFQIALLKANGNPNSNIKKLCPDLILVQSDPSIDPDDIVRLDKSDIKVPSTEWTFSSNGFFEIESVGRVYSGTTVMAEERIETVVKVWDLLRYTTQEQLESDRSWTADTSEEGDLLSGGYPPVVSMPEYAYNPASNPARYRGQTGDVSWCADYEGYLILNGPAKVQAGIGPGPAAGIAGGGFNPNEACWGPNPKIPSPVPASLAGLSAASLKKCGVSFVAGFNMADIYTVQSHHGAWHRGTPNGRHPEYAYDSPHCFADGGLMHAEPAHSTASDIDYDVNWGGAGPKKPYQIEPTAAGIGWMGGTGGANFWDNGCDLQNFGIYINQLRRNRFHTYWADEVPAPDCTIEMTVKPEIDLWSWATNSKMHTVTPPWGSPYTVWPCKRQFLFDWGVGGMHGMNYSIRAYVELSRIYLELYHHPTAQLYVMYAAHNWKPHTWHHVEFSWVNKSQITLSDGSVIDVPANAMMFVDGLGAGSPASVVASGFGMGARTIEEVVGPGVFDVTAMVLPEPVFPTIPNTNVASGPRFVVGGTLANDGSFGMSSPRWHGVIDNIVMHHWRSHTASFTPRNRYHSSTYYDGLSGKGFSGEKAGVYKKRLTFLETEADARDLTIGTVGCTHYHPFHVHLYGHDGTAPTTAFGHITPSIRISAGSGTTYDYSYYDGCVGVPVKKRVTATDEVYYLGWFEVASLVPVTMSPILCDISITYFSEPVTYFRLATTETRK